MRYRKSYNIVSLLLADTTYDYGVTITDSYNDTVNLFTSDQFKNMIKFKFTSFQVLCPQYWDEEEQEFIELIQTKQDAINMLHMMFELWKADRRPAFEKLYNTFRAKYNPIWNVDGVTGTVSENAKSGYDENEHKGDDKLQKSGTETNTRTGNVEHAHTGSDTLEKSYDSTSTRNGTVDVEKIGSETETTQTTTFDSATYRDSQKIIKEPGSLGYKDETNYTNLADARSGSDTDETRYESTMTDTYNSVADALSFNQREDKTVYNSSNKTTYNNKDNFVEMVIRQGNIGVTSTQSLIREQNDITSLDQIIYMAIDDFIHSNCILC